MSDVRRDYFAEIAAAHNDTERLLQLAMEMAGIAQKSQDRSAAAAARQRRRRELSRVVTRRHAESRDVTLQSVTPSSPPSLLSPTPPYNSSSSPPAEKTARARNLSWEDLEQLPGWRSIVQACDADLSSSDGAVDAIGGFLASRLERTWPAWVREMAKLLVGTQFLGGDLAGACNDALALEVPIAGPHALRAFMAKRRDERHKGAPVALGSRVPSAEDRRQGEAREKRQEELRSKREREYVTERDARVSEWERTFPERRHELIHEAEARLAGAPGAMGELIRREYVVTKICQALGFPATAEDWTPERQRVAS